MRCRQYRMRVFAVVWAVLQFALPGFATAADARLAVGSTQGAHVEEGPGANCTLSHSPDCAVCKHLSASSLSATDVPPGWVTEEGGGVVPSRVARLPRVLDGVALPRGPPRQS